jgi:hypothetical protein
MSADPTRTPLEIERLISADQRRTTVADHDAFRRGLYTTDEPALDEIDDDLDDMAVADPYELHAPSRRSDKELARMLDLLDSLPTGNDRKEITR